jgi:hypothetical protein
MIARPHSLQRSLESRVCLSNAELSTHPLKRFSSRQLRGFSDVRSAARRCPVLGSHTVNEHGLVLAPPPRDCLCEIVEREVEVRVGSWTAIHQTELDRDRMMDRIELRSPHSAE